MMLKPKADFFKNVMLRQKGERESECVRACVRACVCECVGAHACVSPHVPVTNTEEGMQNMHEHVYAGVCVFVCLC